MLTIIKKLCAYFGLIFKLRFCLNAENTIQIYHSLIESHLRYSIVIWNHGNITVVKRMQQICNKVISFINKNKMANTYNFLSINKLMILSTVAAKIILLVISVQQSNSFDCNL